MTILKKLNEKKLAKHNLEQKNEYRRGTVTGM